MNKRIIIEKLLQEQSSSLGFLIKGLQPDKLRTLDLSASNTSLETVDLRNTDAFTQWVNEQLDGQMGWGGFMEDRVVYRRSDHFGGAEIRSIHLGVDIWAEAGTPVFAPWEGMVHSFQNNEGFGNYGPTVILEHWLNNQQFYTLYGHLSCQSLAPLSVGQSIATNDRIGDIGPYPENGDWPPHLHFQAMTDLQGWIGDFPGVVAPSMQSSYAEICLDPAYLLRIE